MRNHKQYAHVGVGITVSNYEVCDQDADHFPRIIHIHHPKQPGVCRRAGRDGLTVEWLEGTDLSDLVLADVAAYASAPGHILVHCAAGLGRSPVLAVLCLGARGIKPPHALEMIARSMWDQYAIPRAPNFLSGPLTGVFRFVDSLQARSAK
jgi:hypothetical protein